MFDFKSDPDPEPDPDPLSRKRIRIKMNRIRNTAVKYSRFADVNITSLHLRDNRDANNIAKYHFALASPDFCPEVSAI